MELKSEPPTLAARIIHVHHQSLRRQVCCPLQTALHGDGKVSGIELRKKGLKTVVRLRSAGSGLAKGICAAGLYLRLAGANKMLYRNTIVRRDCVVDDGLVPEWGQLPVLVGMTSFLLLLLRPWDGPSFIAADSHLFALTSPLTAASRWHRKYTLPSRISHLDCIYSL